MADFGIALAVSEAGGGRMTETGLSLGTPNYMSPEQATGDRNIDPRSDIYSLGCMLYEMLTGQPPFGAATTQGVLVRILTEQPPCVTDFRRTVPAHVSSVVARALEKLPADRFESAARLRAGLEDENYRYATVPAPQLPATTTERVNAVVVSDGEARGRPLGRTPMLAAAVLAVAASAAAVLGWTRTPQQEGTTVRAALDFGGMYALPPFQDIEISPNGTMIATPLAETEGQLFGRYAVSNDGVLIYSTDRGQPRTSEKELIIRSLDGSDEVLELEPRLMSAPRWSPDGRRVAFSGHAVGEDREERPSIYVYDVELGSAPRRLVGEGANYVPVWSPDGTHIVFGSTRTGTDGTDLFIREVDSDAPAQLLLSLPEDQAVTDWPEDDLLVIEGPTLGDSGMQLVSLGDSVEVIDYYVPDADVNSLRVSPGGTLAAYTSNESGQDEVYIKSFPDPRAETIVSERHFIVTNWFNELRERTGESEGGR